MGEIVDEVMIGGVEEADISERFFEIVQQIDEVEKIIPEEEKREIESTPIAKAPGAQDQGYRFN